MNIKLNGRKKTNINIEILYEIIFRLVGFHSIEQPVSPSSKVYLDQPINGIRVQNSESINDTTIANETFCLFIFFIFNGFCST